MGSIMALFNIINTGLDCSDFRIEIGNKNECEAHVIVYKNSVLNLYNLIVDNDGVDIELVHVDDEKLIYNLSNIDIADRFLLKASAYCTITNTTVLSNEIPLVVNELTNNTDIYAIYDRTSMQVEDGIAANNALNSWFNEYKANNPDFNGNLYTFPTGNENYLFYLEGLKNKSINYNPSGWENVSNVPENFLEENWEVSPDVLLLAFVDETDPQYHISGVHHGFNLEMVNRYVQGTSQLRSVIPISTFTDNGIDITEPYDVNIEYWSSHYFAPTLNEKINFEIQDKIESGNSILIESNMIITEDVDVPSDIEDIMKLGITLSQGENSYTLRQFAINYVTSGKSNIIERTQPTLMYKNNFVDFMKVKEDFNFFKGVLYPIVRSEQGQGGALILQAMAAMKGRILTQSEIDETNTTVDVSILKTENTYINAPTEDSEYPTVLPLEENGWTAVYDKLSPAEDVFNSETFNEELNDIIFSNTSNCDNVDPLPLPSKYKTFYGNYSNFTFNCIGLPYAPCTEILYHNGENDLPEIGDIVFTDSLGANTLNFDATNASVDIIEGQTPNSTEIICTNDQGMVIPCSAVC